MVNNPVGKKVNTPKVNTWVSTFLRKYPGCLKVHTFLLLALGFYLNPIPDVQILRLNDFSWTTTQLAEQSGLCNSW